MSSHEEELKRQMAENPDDHFSRGLLADHLRDQQGEDTSGRKHTAGERIHWWLGALAHLAKGEPLHGTPQNMNPDVIERGFPGWLARLNQIRGVR
jgi:hypothetical protein